MRDGLDFNPLSTDHHLRSTEAMEIIIVGAGIAGLSAGIGLRRAGHKVTVRSLASLNPLGFLRNGPSDC